ncbi:MAG: ammonium transporter [Lachnospiraceae bacterium]|nr:ammonium transporter [Lachnospiraceae bacterium]MDD7025094.1 ammonium transporter [Oscillospiraceae bacterium]
MYSSVDVIWTLVGAALVFFMQAGFALCEAGMTRAKNTGNILMKNLMDFCIGTPCYWIVGFGIMFGGTGALIGGFDPFIRGTYDFGTLPTMCYVIFQTVFCATAATIVSGSMAERTNFKAYCVYSAMISLLVYPISGHWIWGGGWLASLGFHDFAGSTAVHMVGGVTACIGAKILGPRIGKYDKNGKAHAIPGHNLTAAALGVFILWFCWFGFNGASTVAMSTDADMVSASQIFMNTNMAAAVATCTVMIFTWIRYKKPDVSMSLNGALAGLVAITAGCDMVSVAGAFFIGLIAGIAVVLSVEFFDNVVKIDDPVGAISVHGVCGALGTILTGLFALDGGVFYGGGFHFFGVQVLGVAAVIAWVVVSMTIIFVIIDKTIGLRVPADVEIEGLDIHEHGLVSAYAGFNITDVSTGMEVNANTDLGESDYEKASEKQKAVSVPVTRTETVGNTTGMYKVSIICKPTRYENLKNSLNDIGITGMTVTQVMGCGIQKGAGERYRGAELDINVLPKMKIEVIVGNIPVETVIETAKKALYSGHIGDGKIFVYDVQKVVKVRTGEEDLDALKDVE